MTYRGNIEYRRINDYDKEIFSEDIGLIHSMDLEDQPTLVLVIAQFKAVGNGGQKSAISTPNGSFDLRINQSR
jgi:hypothetical protein